MEGWTGGQYSLYRAVFGLYLFAHFVLAFDDTPVAASILISIGAVAALGFALGLHDRLAAVLISSILFVRSSLFGGDPLLAGPSLLFLVVVSVFLLIHALLPRSPYGSWSARGRTDPRGTWRMPRGLFVAAWVVLAVAYAYSAYTKLLSPSFRDLLLAAPTSVRQFATWAALALELLYAPLALSRRARPWIWTAMAVVHLGRVVFVDSAGLSAGMAIVHLLTFDPRWVPARWSERRDRFFYDGTCGLCHRATRFVLSEDVPGTAFTFAPLQGDTFAAIVASDQRAALPDSVVVRTEAGELLARSDAVIYVLQRLGGLWRVIAAGLLLAPSSLRNMAYTFVARIRHRVFARETTSCPLLPADLRSRFQS